MNLLLQATDAALLQIGDNLLLQEDISGGTVIPAVIHHRRQMGR